MNVFLEYRNNVMPYLYDGVIDTLNVLKKCGFTLSNFKYIF